MIRSKKEDEVATVETKEEEILLQQSKYQSCGNGAVYRPGFEPINSNIHLIENKNSKSSVITNTIITNTTCTITKVINSSCNNNNNNSHNSNNNNNNENSFSAHYSPLSIKLPQINVQPYLESMIKSSYCDNYYFKRKRNLENYLEEKEETEEEKGAIGGVRISKSNIARLSSS